MISVFVGTSLDGFIARLDGTFDFLPPGGGEPHGYDEFIASVDAIVMGRKTFETVLTLGPWPYGNKRVVVLSSRPVDLSAVSGGVVEQMSGPPAQIVAKLAASDAENPNIDGAIMIQEFMCAGLIQRPVITRVPVLIGEGIPLFGTLPGLCSARSRSDTPISERLVSSEYKSESREPLKNSAIHRRSV